MGALAFRWLAMAAVLVLPTLLQAKTIADFEASSFYRGEALVSKSKPYPLQSGGTNQPYHFRDLSNPNSSYVIELTTVRGEVVELTIQWVGNSSSSPATLTSSRAEQLKQLANFLDAHEQSVPLMQYAHAQEGKNYPDGSSSVPAKMIGPLKVRAGATGSGFYVVLHPTSADASAKTMQAINTAAIAQVKVGTSANQVLKLLGRPEIITKLGSDEQGLLAEWRYPGVIYMMGRRAQQGISEFRVIQITKIDISKVH